MIIFTNGGHSVDSYGMILMVQNDQLLASVRTKQNRWTSVTDLTISMQSIVVKSTALSKVIQTIENNVS